MKILLLGSGGREHALAVKLGQSPLCTKLYIAPGNAGTIELGENLPFSVTDFEAIRSFCIQASIEMVVVGPEEPLVKGLVEFLRQTPALSQLMIIGPGSVGAQLEGSKAFAKAFMERNGIPTAEYREFTSANFEAGISYLSSHSLPIVLKADGLAAGKGVLICQSHEEAIQGFTEIIQASKFGDAGKKVVVEEFLQGIEISVFVLTDGKSYVLLPEAKDYKRIGEGDTGLNTGGMGAVSPVPFVDAVLWDKITTRVVEPTIQGLAKEGIDYCGFVFIGFMIVKGEPFVIEYNCRMGDPETEVVMPRLQTDLVALFAAMDNGTLIDANITYDNRSCATIMAVSGGYPGDYEKNKVISGLEDTNAITDTLVFQAGTKASENAVVTSGGRVLAVTAYGNNIQDAVLLAHQRLEKISFEGIYFRRDIGYEFEKK